jgi:hypothetical protein
MNQVIGFVVVVFAGGCLGLAVVDPQYRPRFADLAQIGLSGFLGYLVPSTAARLSTYFMVGEMTQGDPRRVPMDPVVRERILRFAQELDRVRVAWGSGLGVTSWYRPYLVNLAVGGVLNSQHVLGWAADVYPVKGRISEFQSWIDLR